jgi:tRNA-specific 2-thiouridylase
MNKPKESVKAGVSTQVTAKRVVVAMTGRVDSTVAAFLLKKQGYDVLGLAIVVSSSDLTGTVDTLPTCYLKDLDKIRELCERIKIPFYATDVKSEFEYRVIDKLVESKLGAYANSTCFECSKLRMNVLFKKMKSLKADYIATGHYCKVYENLNSNEYFIHSNNTVEVDQSIYLTGLDQELLRHLILPLGELRREEVLKIARNFNLNVESSVKDNSFCFKTADSTKKILEIRVPKSMINEGIFLNKESESIYGDHHGIIYHYIGEKNIETLSGVKIDKTLEVVDYDDKKFFIYLGTEKDLAFKGAQIIDLKVSPRLDRRKPLHCYIKFKYSKEYISSHIFFKNNGSAYIEFEQLVYPLLELEQIVLYDSDNRNSKVMGSALVKRRGSFKALDRVKEFRPKSSESQAGSIDEDSSDRTDTSKHYFRF